MSGRRVRMFLTIGMVMLAVGETHAQGDFAIQLDLKLFSECDFYGQPSDVHILIVNSTDAGDVKSLELRCDFRRPGNLPQGSANNLLVIRTIPLSRGFASVQLSSSWQAASKWNVTASAQWITISGITLPNQSYKLHADWSYFGRTKSLLDQSFIVDASQGPTVRQFIIQDKKIFQILKDRYFGREAAYVSLIVVLLGLLTASVRRRAEKLIDQWMDNLGSYGKGKLAVRLFLKRYTDYLLSTHRYLRLTGFGAAGINRPLLEEVFISLRVSPFDRKRNPAQESSETGLSFEAASTQFSRLVVLGGPGAGKTTTLSYIVLQCIREKEPTRFRFSLPRLPLYVPLRRLSNRTTSLLDDILSPHTQILPADILRECPEGFVKRELERGRCTVLLDGLDEVIDDATHRTAADKINRLVRDYPKNRFVVTCRIAGWRSLLDDFRILEAEDLNRNEVHRFVFGWHRAVITQENRSLNELMYKDADERAAAWEKEKDKVHNSIDAMSRRLVTSLEGSGRLMAVAKNPMLLSLICLVHYVKNILPRERPLLYERCIELLIDAWERAKNFTPTSTTISAYQKETILRAAAVAFQANGKGEASRSEVEQIIEAEARKLGLLVPARELLNQIEQRSGILIERSIDVLGFSHLTLQEYLVAKHMQLDPNAIALLQDNFDNQEWREVTLLYAGLIDDATRLIESIIKVDSFPRWLLAGYTLGEARKCQRKLTQAILDQLMLRFGMRGEDSETLISVISAVTADFTNEPELPEQELSVKLMKHIERKDGAATAAIRVLGKARVTKALPLIVQSLEDSSPDLEKDVTEAITLFGNIALPFIKSWLDRRGKECPASRVIAVLSAIDTAESARLLIECYHHFPTSPDHIAVSLALARMLRNEAIASELLPLREQDLPHEIAYEFPSEDIIWPYNEQVARGFVRLSLKIRDDITDMLRDKEKIASTELNNTSFKLECPAIICFLKSVKDKIPREFWERLGFDVKSEIDLTILERIHKDLRSGQAPIKESIKRLMKVGSSAKEVSKPVRLLRWPCEILLSGFFVADGIISFSLLSRFLPNLKEVFERDYLLVPAIMVASARFIGFSIWGARIAGQGRRLLGVTNALPLILRRTPYILHPCALG